MRTNKFLLTFIYIVFHNFPCKTVTHCSTDSRGTFLDTVSQRRPVIPLVIANSITEDITSLHLQELKWSPLRFAMDS